VRTRTLLPSLALLALLGGCASVGEKPSARGASITVEPETKADVWMAVATDVDESKLDRLGLAWQSALADALPRYKSQVDAEGELLMPRAALPRPAPTPGSYNCRMVRLGSTTKDEPPFEKYRPFFCYVEVEGELLTIVKQTGSQRPAGRLWEDDRPERLIFLGSLALGNEEQPLAYGEDPKRDMAGVFERIGPFRWRLVIPFPEGGAKMHVFELTPVADQPEG
jgi:hypothetical protein